MKKLFLALMACGLLLGPHQANAASASSAAGAALDLAELGAGVMVTGCCMNKEPIASQTAIQKATALEYTAMKEWEMSNNRAIMAAASSINVGSAGQSQSTNGGFAMSQQGAILGQAALDSSKRMTMGVSEADKSCIPNLNYYLIKGDEAVRAAAAQMTQYQRNVLSGLNIDAKDVIAKQAERALLARSKGLPFAGTTLTPDQLEGTQAYFDVFFTANVPDPDPSDVNSQDKQNWIKEKNKYIFAQMLAADTANRWLAARAPMIPAQEINSTLAFYSIEPPVINEFQIDSKGKVLDPENVKPKPIGSGDQMSLEAANDSVLKIFLSDRFLNEALDSERQLVNVLKVEAENAHLLNQIKNHLETSNLMMAMFLGLQNDEQFKKLSQSIR